MQMAPMIDMVFLLLVFFMVSAKPIKQESDLGLALPGAAAQEESVDIPDEQRIVIAANGQIILNDLSLDTPESRDLPALLATLKRFKEAADLSKAPALVTLAPDDAAPHQRVVDVLSACALAELTNVTFAAAGEGGGEVEP